MTPQLVLKICGCIFFAILVWDLYLDLDGRKRNTISQAIIDKSKVKPLLPWFIGFVMGALTFHWFEL